jgi:phosphoglycolate phosphatase-like HAD superfamily hydrolase
VRELFERLKRDGVLVALASSAYEEELGQHQKSLQIEDLVDAVTSADDAEHSKPCPDIFEAALARLDGIAPHEAIVIGDTPHDAVAAAAAGMHMIGLLSGGFSEETLRENGALAIYEDVADLLQRYESSPLSKVASALHA